MYSITIANDTIKRYRLQWRSHNGKRYYVKRRRTLHGISIQDVKDRAKLLFGITPDSVQRI